MHFKNNIIKIVGALLIISTTQASEFWEENIDIPEVLSASRLKQPKSEAPASVTVIEAEQIEAWGARTIPEVLRFVPGMFVGHSPKENTATVVYHASSQNIMRRLQVLVDGRSVYKAAIARVIWEDIPVAVEDIQRIEVIRGPSSATYGSNAFMATINIITKAAADTLGTRVRYRGGNQSVDDRLVSHSAELGKGAFRLTGSYQADDGFDGHRARNGEDIRNDDSRHQFINLSLQQQFTERVGLHLDLGLTDNYADITSSGSSHETQYRDGQSANALMRLNFDFSAKHQSHLQAYWQRENREHFNRSRTMPITLDPVLAQLYNAHPDDMRRITSLAQSQQQFDDNLAEIMAIAEGFSPADQAALMGLVARVGEEKIYATFDYGYSERRADVEWQDTVQWHPRLRTVSGVSFRHDQVRSQTFFGGEQTNDTYRAFANMEWQALQSLIMNLGGTYEYDEMNGESFTPRVAFNILASPQQSFRLIFSQAVRAPDMLEQTPNYRVILKDLTDNYLGLTEGPFYITNVADNKGLKHEKINSYEFGYYGSFINGRVEIDAKVYHDELRRLISADPTNIEALSIDNDSRMDIEGAELQLSWQFWRQDWLWLTAAYMDIDKRIVNLDERCTETCLSPRKSGTASWHHKGHQWSNTISYLWLDGFADNQNLYHRAEWNIRKEWKLNRWRPWVGGYWQYQLAHQPLGADAQRYSTRHRYYLQAGLNF